MSRTFLPVILLLHSLLVLIADGLELFPRQLHCSTTMYLTNKGGGADAESTSTNPTDLYQVEEYVDLDARRSTISVVDVVRDSTKIYYNLVGPPQSNGRSFTLYHPQMHSCEEQSITDTILAPLRQLATNLHQSTANVRQEQIGVSIGPSSLLYAIENNLSSFVFQSRILSKSKMTNVDVFAREINYETFIGEENINIIVHVMARGRDSPKEGDTLASIDDQITGMDIVLIGACKTGSRDNLESIFDNIESFFGSTKPESFKKAIKKGEKGKTSKKDDEPQQSKQHPIDIQLGEDSFCDRASLMFTIHYHIASLYKPGTLVGKSLEDFGEVTEYNFQLEPFVLPVGIGCLSDGISSRPDWQKRLTRGRISRGFSAEFVSSYGEPGVSYVAYDWKMGLLRLDQAGRKSIYDAHSTTSYHMGEFPSQSVDLDSKASENEDRSVSQCIVLEMLDKTSPIPGKFTKKDIIGFWIEDNERYLGSRMLDHVNYDVFEIEWTDGRRLPLILRSVKSIGFQTTENKRLFLTYYAKTVSISEQSDAIAASRQEKGAVDQTEDVEIPLLSFVEVWEFHTLKKERHLINRVKFLEFSWDLDIEPSDDPASRKSGPVDARVFDIEPCHQDRASQAELVIKFIREAREDATQVDELKDNQYIVSYAHSFFATVTEIPILNLVDVNARILDSGDVLATTRVVELRSGISTKHDLGLFAFKLGEFGNEIVNIVLNRHSHDECRLESISVSSTDLFAHCPNMAACLILKDSQHLRSKLKIGKEAEGLAEKYNRERSGSQDGANWDVCKVESLNYKTVDVVKSGHGMLERAFNFFQASKTVSPERHFWMDSAIYPYVAVAYKQLDSLGTRLNNDVTLLSNLRYSTKEEDPSNENLNTRVTAKTKMGAFRFCQLACQMDDFCGSFSMCSSPTRDGMEQADCVLSVVRLTSERLNTIMAAAAAARRSEKFSVTVVDKQVLVPDESCSIHPKDFLADYHIDQSYRYLKKNPVHDANAQTERPKADKRHLDLEDCAGLRYESNLWNVNPGNATFWYCPLDSHCIADDREVFSPADVTEYCYIYKRYPTRPYIRQPMTHMAAIKLDSPSTGQQHANTPLDKLNLLEKYTRNGNNQLAKMSWAWSEDQCANDCNRHKSRCLAFDSCRFASYDQVLCILYPSRSPAMRESALFPLLEQEKNISANYRVELQEINMCDHFYLREDYFEVRLDAMLDDEKKGIVVYQNDKKHQAVKELDEKIDSEEKRQSDEIVNSLIEDTKQIVEIEAENERRGPSGNQLIHWMSLIFGLVVGAVGILYRQQISEGVGRVHKNYRNRRARTNSINDLVLTDQDV